MNGASLSITDASQATSTTRSTGRPGLGSSCDGQHAKTAKRPLSENVHAEGRSLRCASATAIAVMLTTSETEASR